MNNSNALAEIQSKYPNCNLLLPAATSVQINPFYKCSVMEVVADTAPSSGDDMVLLGTPTELYASPEHKAGKAYKTLAVSSSETEADVNVFIASATIRRCGTRSCGNKE